MFHLFFMVNLLNLPIEIYQPEEDIIPGDELIIAQHSKTYLYISMEEGLLVMNNDLYNKNAIDYVIPISIKKIDYKYLTTAQKYYEILIDGFSVCSYGNLQKIGECNIMEDRDSRWLLKGTDRSVMIEGRGGCMTVREPNMFSDSFKHEVWIDTCDNLDTQKFTIKRDSF